MLVFCQLQTRSLSSRHQDGLWWPLDTWHHYPVGTPALPVHTSLPMMKGSKTPQGLSHDIAPGSHRHSRFLPSGSTLPCPALPRSPPPVPREGNQDPAAKPLPAGQAGMCRGSRGENSSHLPISPGPTYPSLPSFPAAPHSHGPSHICCFHMVAHVSEEVVEVQI